MQKISSYTLQTIGEKRALALGQPIVINLYDVISLFSFFYALIFGSFSSSLGFSFEERLRKKILLLVLVNILTEEKKMKYNQCD